MKNCFLVISFFSLFVLGKVTAFETRPDVVVSQEVALDNSGCKKVKAKNAKFKYNYTVCRYNITYFPKKDLLETKKHMVSTSSFRFETLQECEGSREKVTKKLLEIFNKVEECEVPEKK